MQKCYESFKWRLLQLVLVMFDVLTEQFGTNLSYD
jgi:hypothetical protein